MKSLLSLAPALRQARDGTGKGQRDMAVGGCLECRQVDNDPDGHAPLSGTLKRR